jgi:MYXO-CTERM domain-containing protein
MNKASLITAAATLTLTGAAMAGSGFEGFTGVVGDYDDGFGGNWTTIDMFANFSDDSFAVLNVFNSDIFASDDLGFHHNDLADASGGSWKPSFSFDIAGAYDPMRDSYATIGYGVGAMAALNNTALDPGFGSGIGPDIPENAGWFNLAPDNPQYASGGQLHVGHFVMAADRAADFTFEAEIGYNTGAGTEVFFGAGIFTTVPAPGALALLGLGGLIARRRRA